MALSSGFFNDGFDCSNALRTFHDLVRWLSLRQNWEESYRMSDCGSVAKNWDVFSHDDRIYVQVRMGMNGQDLLHHFPGFSTLPVTPGEQLSFLGTNPCRGQTFFFGPFADEFDNL